MVRFATVHRLAAGAALGALTLWMAGAAVRESRLASRDAGDPGWSFRLGASEDERIRRFLGEDVLAFRAVIEHVPDGGLVVVEGGLDVETRTRASYLRNLLYPRLLIPRDTAISLASDDRLDPDRPLWLLDLAAQRAPRDPQQFVAVAAHPRFALFRYRRPDR
jgi:hypothetical protein